MDQRTDTAKLLEEALRLSRESRALLAEKLLASLDHGEPFEISDAWMAEIRRRCKEIDDGQAELLDADQVFDEIDHVL